MTGRALFILPTGLGKSMYQSARALTVIAVVDVNTVAVVKPLDRARQVDVEVEVVGVLLVADAGEVREDVLVDVEREGRGRELLVVGGRVEGESLVDDFDDLRRVTASQPQSHDVGYPQDC